EFQSFPQGSEICGMPADFIADAQGVDSDLTGFSDDIAAMAIEGQGILGSARCFENRLSQAHGRTAGGVFLEAVMSLDNLDVVTFTEDFGDVAGDFEEAIHT